MKRHASLAPLVALLLAPSWLGCPSLTTYYRAGDKRAEAHDVTYRDDGDAKHRLDLYVPTTAEEPFSTVVFVHGGYWRGGDKNLAQPITGLYGNVGTALTELGIGAVVPSYRLWPDTDVEGMLDDVAAAIAWTERHIAERGGDPARLVLCGHSAGGHLVAWLGAHPEALRARGVDPRHILGVVAISGVYDVERTRGLVDEELRDGVFAGLFPDEETARRYSLSQPREAPAPMMFLVGEHDYPSSLQDFDDVQRRLADLEGTRAFFARIPGNTHEDMVLELAGPKDEVGPRIAAFTRRLTR